MILKLQNEKEIKVKREKKAKRKIKIKNEKQFKEKVKN